MTPPRVVGGHAHRKFVEIAEKQARRDGALATEAEASRLATSRLRQAIRQRDNEMARRPSLSFFWRRGRGAVAAAQRRGGGRRARRPQADLASRLLAAERGLVEATRDTGRDAVNLEYVKNLVVQYTSRPRGEIFRFSRRGAAAATRLYAEDRGTEDRGRYLSLRPGSSEHASLVPVLATVLAFTPADISLLRAAARKHEDAKPGLFGSAPDDAPNPLLSLTSAPAPRDRARSPPLGLGKL